MSILAPLALTASTGTLLMLPLAPALRELKSKRDAGPLATRKDDGRIENFAISLRRRFEALHIPFAEAADCETNAFIEHDGAKVFLVTRPETWMTQRRIDSLVMCAVPSRLPHHFESIGDFYALEKISTGQSTVFRALLGEDEIVLGAGSKVLRWIHAEAGLLICENCLLFGRTSSAKSITLSSGCRFERVHAPAIYSSRYALRLPLRTESSPFSKLARAGIGRRRVIGDAHLRQGEQHRGDLICTKGLIMEDGASVLGSVKANAKACLKRRTVVDGALVSTKAISIGPGSFVKGPIISEEEIVISSGVQVGLPGARTTVSAPRIRIASGSVLHGTVWARVEGCTGD
jgi:cytoskeletal protein CcmA (bactofilin family)